MTSSLPLTAPARPDPSIRVSAETDSSVEISWNQKGIFDNFTIEYLGHDESFLAFRCDRSSCSAVVDDLPTPGREYNISLTAVVDLKDGKNLSSLPRNFLAQTG